MKKCLKCNQVFNDDSQFCQQCGSALSEVQALVCANCGAPINGDVKFCPNCGHQLSDFNVGSQKIVQDTNQNSNTVNNYNAVKQPEETWKQKFFSFKGRLNRESYILRSIAIILTLTILAAATGWGILGGLTLSSPEIAIFSMVLFFVMYVILLVSEVSLGVRRFHDLNKSGWYVLLCILVIPSIYIIFAEGTKGANKYGPDPLEQ